MTEELARHVVDELHARTVLAVGIGADLARTAEGWSAGAAAIVSLETPIDRPIGRRYDLAIALGPLDERTIAHLAAATDVVLVAADGRDVARFAPHGLFRDVDEEAPGAVCLRRHEGPSWPVIAAYERRLAQLEREAAGRSLVGVEYRELLRERELLIERLAARVEWGDLLGSLAAAKMALVPPGSLRERLLERLLRPALGLARTLGDWTSRLGVRT